MALKVKAKERLQKVGKYAGTYRYVMLPDMKVVYASLILAIAGVLLIQKKC